MWTIARVEGRWNLIVQKLSVREPNQATDTKDGDLYSGIDFLYAHPEALFGEEGRKLMRSKDFLSNVAAVVIDEAHCIKT